jgi:arylsulfatase A-like enzyme
MANPPNILFISIDDLNDWVGVLGGYPGVKTPNIDRLAERGTLFTNAHTPVPVCNGARTAVLTGLSPTTTGIYSNNQDWRTTLPDVVSLPEYFSQHGYETVGAGKIF